ncbi:MAG: glycosyltransferase family 4 protein [Bradymonadia bacterium]
MHVLLLGLNYYPDKLGNAPLMTGLCEGLVARGHQVTVVCAFPHHETGQIEPAFRGKLFQRDEHNGVDILRVWLYAPQGGMVAKMANYASFTATALAAASTVRDVDVIFTPSPPLTLGIVDQFISKFRNIPFVYNLQDLFPEAAIRLGMMTNPLMVSGFRALERHVLHKADHLSVISPSFEEHCLRLGVPASDISVIPNYTDVDFITPRPKNRNQYREELGYRGKFVIQFSGRMGYSQGLETVVEMWKQIRHHEHLRLMLVGDGQARPMLEAELGDDEHVNILPTQPRAALPELLAASDLGLVPLRHGMAGTSLPCKIFGILAAGRPMVASLDLDSDAAALIRDADCGLVTPPEDANALADAVLKLYKSRKTANRQGRNGRQYVVDHHSHKVVVDRYEEMLTDVINRRHQAAG